MEHIAPAIFHIEIDQLAANWPFDQSCKKQRFMMMTNIHLCSASRCLGWTYRLFNIGNLFVGLAVAPFLYLLVCTQAAEALELRCGDANVVVHSPNSADANSVCEGAADAIRFLRAQGLKTSGQVEVIIVDKLPDLIGSQYGGYIHTERRAYLLISSKIAERGTLFNFPFDRSLYRSLAIHEVAHAIAAINFHISNPQIEAEEYIAYVAMFATMPTMYRDPLLKRLAHEKFENEIQINTSVYTLNPFRFGVLSYKHFMKLVNRADFLQKVLRGRALAEFAY